MFMTYPVTYHCPHCETIVALERDGYLADKSVTPYPFEGWQYVEPTAPFEDGAADGVRFVCGESEGVTWDPSGESEGDPGCGEPFYLSFVRYEDGTEIDPRPEGERVRIDPDPRPSGPRGPGGPSGSGGFW
jgi:hypothetical protein